MNFKQKITENSFEWLNPNDFKFRYRVAPIELICLPNDSILYHRQIKKIIREVSREIAGPAVKLYSKKRQKLYIAVPFDRTLENFKVQTKPNSITLTLEKEIYALNFAECAEQEWELIKKFVEFEVRKQIKDSKNVFEDTAGRFICKQPLGGCDSYSVDIFNGFVCKMIAEGKNKVHFVTDITFRMLAKKSLGQLVNIHNAKFIKNRILSGGKLKKNGKKSGLKCIYKFGDIWFPIEVFDFGGKIIDEQIIHPQTREECSLYDYVIEKTKNASINISKILSPDDITIYYKLPGKEMDMKSAPASLIFQLFGTGDSQVRGLHNRTIIELSERFGEIKKMVNWALRNISFEDVKLNISSRPSELELNAFALKDLRFNNDQILKGTKYNQNKLYVNPEYQKQRKYFLERNGILNQSTFDTQYLIVPDTSTMPKRLREIFQERLEEQLKRLSGKFSKFRDVITYQADITKSATDLVKNVQEAVQQHHIEGGFALLILPDWGKNDNREGNFYRMIRSKKVFPDLSIQCASFDMIQSYFEFTYNEEENKDYRHKDNQVARFFKSYLFNLSLEYVKLNRKFPYALHVAPNYEIYIAIDVHEFYVGFIFFYKNGEHIKFEYADIPPQPGKTRGEKLSADIIFKGLYAHLKRHIERGYCKNPNSIIILRDGMTHGGETIAIKKIIEQLHIDGVISHANLPFAVVELHKTSSVPLRIATNDNPRKILDKPLAGTYRLLGREYKEAFLFPTAEPFRTKGSPKPLQLVLVEERGIDFKKIIEDIFGQCLLAFSAADLPNMIPISQKLLDAYIQPYATSDRNWSESENMDDSYAYLDEATNDELAELNESLL